MSWILACGSCKSLTALFCIGAADLAGALSTDAAATGGFWLAAARGIAAARLSKRVYHIKGLISRCAAQAADSRKPQQ